MNLIKKGNLEYFVFDIFENTGIVKHAFTTKNGGVSKGCFESLNLGFNRGDSNENVVENYKILCNALSLDYKNIVFGKQIHKTEIKNITKQDCGNGILFPTKFVGFDGFITNEKNVIMVTFHADCVPLFFLDTITKTAALVHAGWRGTVNQIALKTVDKMINDYGASVENILCGIGPSIGVCCFQVGKEVREEYIKKLPFSSKFIFDDTEKEKYKIDLWGINKEMLIKKGLKSENIEIADICTKCSKNLFYSHRNSGTNRGTMIAIMTLI